MFQVLGIVIYHACSTTPLLLDDYRSQLENHLEANEQIKVL
jgi:hypothetical protein